MQIFFGDFDEFLLKSRRHTFTHTSAWTLVM